MLRRRDEMLCNNSKLERGCLCRKSVWVFGGKVNSVVSVGVVDRW